MEVRDIPQEEMIKTNPKQEKFKKAKWLSEEALQIAEGKKKKKKTWKVKEKRKYIPVLMQSSKE